MNENLQQKNLGVKLMPEENYVVADDTSFNFWRIISFSPDYFEDIKYLNLLDFFCIQNPDKNLFIHLEEVENEDPNISLIADNTHNKIRNTIKNELYIIKEEKEELIDNKSEIISEIKSENKSDILDNNNKKKLFQSINNDLVYIKNKNNISDSTVIFMDNRIEINYFCDSNFNKNKNYKLKVDSYDDKEHLKPFSLFKIEFLLDELKDFDYISNLANNANKVHDEINVRFISIFANKVLYADKIKNNQYKLFLVNDMLKTDKRYPNTIFSIQQIKDTQDFKEDENENMGEEENKDDNNEKDNEKEKENENNYIKKNSFIKIYSNKFSAYIGIRIRNENNYKELILTNSMSDITKFKFNCLDEEDKYELHFFEQLLLSFNNILKYFENENKTVTIIKQNYERIQHILITLKNKLNQFRKNNNNRDVKNLNLQENKFDFIEIIQHFKIVSKLTELFLSNWFRNYHDYSYERLETKIKEYFQDNKDILKYKLIISREILNILTTIYELNPSYLNAIEDSLLYFFMFVGRDDKCTKFLFDILKNNKLLLISLCPLSEDNLEKKEESIENEENINEINSLSRITDNEEKTKKKKKFKELKFCNLKKCLKRIIKDYNNMTIDQLKINFSSVSLFFNLMNNLLILDNIPFEQFYNDYFKDLGLLKPIEDNKLKPNYEQNPLLIDFYLNGDNELYARKIDFSNKERNESNRIIDIKVNNLIDIISNYNYDTEEDRDNIIFAKLVSINLFFYSFLSLCDDKFKNYMENIFKFDHLINNYLTSKYNMIDNTPYIDNIYEEEKKYNNNNLKIKKENPLMNDLKCSIIQVLTYLYLKVPSPFIIKTHLFKIINNEKMEEKTIVTKSELKKIIFYIDLIINNKEEKLNIKIIDYYCLIQILELIKYTLRNFYLIKNNIEEPDRDNIYNLIINVMNILIEFLGLSENNDDQCNEEKMLNSLNSIANDKLDLIDPIFLVSENYQYVFLKYKNKLEEAIKSQNEKGNNIKTFLDILTDICDNDRIQKNKYDFGKAEITKKNIKLLRKFNLKKVLLDVSINSNRNNENVKNYILLTMEEIIQEFLEYLEYATIEGLGDDINIQNDFLDRKEFENRLKTEVINKKMSTKYLDEFKRKKIGENEFPISIYFFKFLTLVDNTKLKYLALEILYKLNNAKKIFYFDMSNLVILETKEEYIKFVQIKELFIIVMQMVKNLNLIQRLDNNSIVLCNKLKKQVEILLENLFDEDKWNEENNALNDDEDFKFEDSIGIIKESNDSSLYSEKDSKIDEEEDDKEEDKEEDKKNDSKSENKSIRSISQHINVDKNLQFESDSSEENNINTSLKKRKLTKTKTNLEGDYFLKEYDYENLIIYQQTLYNLMIFLHI